MKRVDRADIFPVDLQRERHGRGDAMPGQSFTLRLIGRQKCGAGEQSVIYVADKRHLFSIPVGDKARHLDNLRCCTGLQALVGGYHGAVPVAEHKLFEAGQGI